MSDLPIWEMRLWKPEPVNAPSEDRAGEIEQAFIVGLFKTDLSAEVAIGDLLTRLRAVEGERDRKGTSLTNSLSREDELRVLLAHAEQRLEEITHLFEAEQQGHLDTIEQRNQAEQRVAGAVAEAERLLFIHESNVMCRCAVCITARQILRHLTPPRAPAAP